MFIAIIEQCKYISFTSIYVTTSSETFSESFGKGC